jgi:hypothetical protein
MQAQTRMSGARLLLVERAAILLRRMWHDMGQVWRRQRRRQAAARPQRATGGLCGGMGALLGRAWTGRRTGGRILAVEERLALGPKQHLYVIRCGEQRLLLASAAEGSMQWMALPEEQEEQAKEREDVRDNTHPELSGAVATEKRRVAKALAGQEIPVRRAARRAGVEGAR